MTEIMMLKIALIACMLIVVWMAASHIVLKRNFIEFREISKYNDNVLKSALQTHTNAISKLTEMSGDVDALFDRIKRVEIDMSDTRKTAEKADNLANLAMVTMSRK